jgi:hypothetical protein
MAGHDVYFKNEKRTNYQAATIENNSNPVLFSFRRRCSTHWMAGHNVYYKRKKRMIRLQQSTTTAIPERQSTTIICNHQKKAITNFVLLSLNWSESVLQTNGVENIPPRINLGLECRNERKIYLF